MVRNTSLWLTAVVQNAFQPGQQANHASNHSLDLQNRPAVQFAGQKEPPLWDLATEAVAVPHF